MSLHSDINRFQANQSPLLLPLNIHAYWWVRAQLCKLQKRVHSTRSDKVIKITSCLHMVGGSLQVLWLPPPLKLVAMI